MLSLLHEKLHFCLCKSEKKRHGGEGTIVHSCHNMHYVIIGNNLS